MVLPVILFHILKLQQQLLLYLKMSQREKHNQEQFANNISYMLTEKKQTKDLKSKKIINQSTHLEKTMKHNPFHTKYKSDKLLKNKRSKKKKQAIHQEKKFFNKQNQLKKKTDIKTLPTEKKSHSKYLHNLTYFTNQQSEHFRTENEDKNIHKSKNTHKSKSGSNERSYSLPRKRRIFQNNFIQQTLRFNRKHVEEQGSSLSKKKGNSAQMFKKKKKNYFEYIQNKKSSSPCQKKKDNSPKRKSKSKKKKVSVYQLFQTQIVNKIIFTMSDQLKSSQMSSEKPSSRLQQITLPLIIDIKENSDQERILQEIRKVQAKPLINNKMLITKKYQNNYLNICARKIQESWKKYKNRKMLIYYKKLFQKNQRLEIDMSLLYSDKSKKLDKKQEIQKFQNSLFKKEEGSYFRQSDLEIDNSQKQKHSYNPFYGSNQDQRSIQYQQSEIDFPVNKYEHIHIKKKDQRFKTQPLDYKKRIEEQKQNISKLRKENLDRWKKFHQWICDVKNDQKSKGNPELLFEQILKKSEENKKWIEQKYDSEVLKVDKPAQQNIKLKHIQTLCKEQRIMDTIKSNQKLKKRSFIEQLIDQGLTNDKAFKNIKIVNEELAKLSQRTVNSSEKANNIQEGQNFKLKIMDLSKMNKSGQKLFETNVIENYLDSGLGNNIYKNIAQENIVLVREGWQNLNIDQLIDQINQKQIKRQLMLKEQEVYKQEEQELMRMNIGMISQKQQKYKRQSLILQIQQYLIFEICKG